MAMGITICFMMLIKLVTAVAETPTTLNKTCVGDISVLLQFDVYQESCPVAEPIILSWVQSAISEEPRMAASLLRLHFHDCFVNASPGCDASVLLDDTDNFVGEKTAPPNLNSLRGFEVIDAIKSDLESVCPQTVSCADILAIVARDSVLLGGKSRREGGTALTASKAAATNSLPAPNSSVATLVANFQNVGTHTK
ncbi:hypothetical protein OIU77_012169 [Salix suchowensis]|uniref:peroxidase n=1 Tax=Salix suchowensis TaxID=1278906 RepID=A0ABQ9A3W2_9ROSI|nr:hypothetical protein OIU77_012169 [Salix suchowensis]